jgi:hypothetical protein
MKALLPFVRSYTKNFLDVITDIKSLTLPENALLFLADAKSMYTNIDTDIGLESIKCFLQDNRNNLPTNFPTDLFQQVLEAVMKNNIFRFADTYWLQLTGTAMGTPTACSYASITYGRTYL